jgi:hypothetical protein
VYTALTLFVTEQYRYSVHCIKSNPEHVHSY